MIYPVSVNIEIIDGNGFPNIVSSVLDLHYSKIESICNTVDGKSSIRDDRGFIWKILIPYKEMLHIYNIQQTIDTRFQEEVDEYLKDNYRAFKTYKNKKNGETN